MCSCSWLLGYFSLSSSLSLLLSDTASVSSVSLGTGGATSLVRLVPAPLLPLAPSPRRFCRPVMGRELLGKENSSSAQTTIYELNFPPLTTTRDPGGASSHCHTGSTEGWARPQPCGDLGGFGLSSESCIHRAPGSQQAFGGSWRRAKLRICHSLLGVRMRRSVFRRKRRFPADWAGRRQRGK